MFKICPPSIDEYLPMNEELEPAPLTVFNVEVEDSVSEDETNDSNSHDDGLEDDNDNEY